MTELPAVFQEKMKHLLKEEYPDYIRCFDEPRHYGLRVNTNKISPEEFEQICPFEITRIPWIANGYYYDGDQVSPAKHPYYYAGLYYLQEPSAMTPASRLPVSSGDRVLDLCAAPGGKATELGARLGGSGVLVANDISSSRAKGLLKNIEVFGIGNVLVLSEEPGRLAGRFDGWFDKILIDAPCSGEGMFRKDKKMIRAYEAHGPEFFANIQKSIIRQALEMLRPGGDLLYSTCTFDARENERIIDGVLTEFPELELSEIIPWYDGFTHGMPELTDSGDPQLGRAVRIFPHKMKGEGHFLALLHKQADATDERRGKDSGIQLKKIKDSEPFDEFMSHISRSFDRSRMMAADERIYYLPENLPRLNGLRFLRSGLLLGENKKKRFEPSQALAMNLKMTEYDNILNLRAEDERVRRYLKGESIEAAEAVQSGWCLICIDGYSLGWGKAQNGRIKNKYLPGWRMMS